MVRNIALESFGTGCGAASHDSGGQGLMKHIFANCGMYFSKALLCRIGYSLTSTWTGVFVGCSSIFISGTFAGSPVRNLIRKICL